MSYFIKQEEWAKKHKVKPGTLLHVSRAPEENELEWDGWLSWLDEFIGETHEVSKITTKGIIFTGYPHLAFPFFILEQVTDE